jgi:Integrase zinc binding domain/RNase H-like domain found in reverse transcriptase
VETLKEFRNILLGQKIVVYTDHKNLTCKNFNTERVMHWRLILKEYSPELRYIQGESNVVADALSRLDMLADHPVSEEQVAEMFAPDSDMCTWAKAFPLAYLNIEDHQKNDPEIQKAFQEKKDLYKEMVYLCGDHSFTLITKNDKIILPKALQTEAVKWYHGALMHPGETRTELTMGQHYTWKGMRKTVQKVCKKCSSCTLNKPKLQKLGHLPKKELETIP